MKTIVPTCQSLHWTLQPFFFLHNLYWSELQDVIVGGGGPGPAFPLPRNFTYRQLRATDYPVGEWSTQVIDLLNSVSDDIVVWLLGDYWLTRTVDCTAVSALADLMRGNPNILRIDLTADRQFNGHVKELPAYGRLDMVETGWDSEYQLSTQAALVNRTAWLSFLREGVSPWDYELYFQNEAREKTPHLRVLGTKQSPVRYVNGVGTGHKAPWTEGIPAHLVDDMRARGYFKEVES